MKMKEESEKVGLLWFMGSQRVGHDWAAELNWTEDVIQMLEKLRC